MSCYEITADGGLRLHDPVAGSARLGEKGLRDEAISGDGRYLYAIDADAQKLVGWAVGQDSHLTPAGEPGGCPARSPGWPPAGRGLHQPAICAGRFDDAGRGVEVRDGDATWPGPG